MNHRMNLFRQIRRPEKKKSEPLKLSTFTSSFHLMAGGGMLAIVLIGLLASFISYRRNVSATKLKVAETQKAMAELVAQSDALREQREKENADHARPSRVPASEKINTLDGTWTALVWKLAAYSGAQVQFIHVTLGSSAGPPGAGGNKEVVIDGSAASVVYMRDWLSALLHNVPGYDFVMEYQNSSGGDSHYPVSFRVTARVQ